VALFFRELPNSVGCWLTPRRPSKRPPCLCRIRFAASRHAGGQVRYRIPSIFFSALQPFCGNPPVTIQSISPRPSISPCGPVAASLSSSFSCQNRLFWAHCGARCLPQHLDVSPCHWFKNSVRSFFFLILPLPFTNISLFVPWSSFLAEIISFCELSFFPFGASVLLSCSAEEVSLLYSFFWHRSRICSAFFLLRFLPLYVFLLGLRLPPSSPAHGRTLLYLDSSRAFCRSRFSR